MEVRLIKNEIELLRKKSGASNSDEVRAEMEQQKIAQKQRELAWKQLKDIGKAWK